MKYKFSDAVDIIGGGTPKTSIAEYWGGDIPWLSVKDFNKSTRYVYTAEKCITEKGLNNSATCLLEKDDCIISARGTIGELAMIPFPMAFNQSCYGLRAKPGVINSTYLYYFIKSKITELKHKTHGSVFDTITRDTLGSLELEIPSMSKQLEVVKMLVCLDDKIELNTAINKNLEQQVSAIYHAWFEEFLPYGSICPTNWKLSSLDSIAKITSGKRPMSRSAVKTGDFKISLVGAASVIGFTNKANYADKILVIGRVGTHGVVQRFSSPCWASDNTLVISSDYYEYTNQILRRIDYATLNRGSTQPLITQGDVKQIEILLPDEDSLLRFEAVAKKLMALCEANIVENSKLSSLRDMLLPRLMSGELDVASLPS